LYVSLVDRHTQEFFIKKIGENNEALSTSQVVLLQSHATQKLERMFQYAYARRCRRRSILDYFGDDSEVKHCSCDVCRGDVRMQPSPAAERTGNRRKPAARPKKSPEAEAAPLDTAAAQRFQRLKAARLQLALQQDLPAFCIAHDSVLRDVARSAPQTLNALAGIKGIGAQKLEKFGTAFLQAVKTE
jgi:superfamily II DNA helicase RecQ